MLFILFNLFYFLNNSAEEKIIEKALNYSPPELKIIINDNLEEFKNGIKEGRKEILNLNEIEKKIKELSKHFYEKKQVHNFIYELGKISVQTIRSTYTFKVSEKKLYTHIKNDFPLYLEKKLKKFPIVFYGFDKNFFKGDIKNFLELEKKEKDDYLILLEKGYIKGDILLNRFSFDDRSNSFGVAQIYTNKTFSLILNVWYYIWIKNGGRWEPLKPHQLNNKLWVLAYGY